MRWSWAFCNADLRNICFNKSGVVKVLRVAFEESGRRQFRLLDVQILRLLKLQQRTDVIGLRRINDDDALALFELAYEMVTVERGQHGHGDGDEKPEPRQTVALREKLGWIETLPGEAVGGGRLHRWRLAGIGVRWFP